MANKDETPSHESDPAKEFLLEEQKQRRVEIENDIARVETDQRNVLLGSGFYWTWVLTSTPSIKPSLKLVAALLPLTITAFFYLRLWAIDKNIKRNAAYTRALEQKFGVSPEYGWETFVTKLGRKECDKQSWPDPLNNQDLLNKIKGEPMPRVNHIFWPLLLTANFVVGVLFYLA